MPGSPNNSAWGWGAEMRCPPQLQFEHGTVGPRRTFYLVGSELTFECRDGYTLRGSALRRCLPTGRWDGEMPACDDGGEPPTLPPTTP